MDTALNNIVQNSKRMVFFGGAGVSTESGIPDFRSETGLYSSMTRYGRSPEEIISHTFFMRDPVMFYDYYKNNMIYREAKPNPAHKALARLEKDGILSAVVTQNIDGLHQLAGSVNVFELHGSVHRNYCMDCHEFYPLSYIMDENNCKNGVPICRRCGGVVKPDVVLYEEGLDQQVLNGAVEAIRGADTMMVGGTSLVVYPAAGLLEWFRGKHLVLINRDRTNLDGRADLVITGSIGEVLGESTDRT